MQWCPAHENMISLYAPEALASGWRIFVWVNVESGLSAADEGRENRTTPEGCPGCRVLFRVFKRNSVWQCSLVVWNKINNIYLLRRRRQRERERDRDRARDRHTDRDRQTDRQTDRETGMLLDLTERCMDMHTRVCESIHTYIYTYVHT